jgi:8-amino-7-oxononanoate synthase
VEAALQVLRDEPERRGRLHRNCALFRKALEAGGIDCGRGTGPIVPVVLGENERALAAAKFLKERDFDVRAVRPPTVPEGTARLRISIHADHLPQQLEGLAGAIAEAIDSIDRARGGGAG